VLTPCSAAIARPDAGKQLNKGTKRYFTPKPENAARAMVGCSRLLAILLLFEEIRLFYFLKYHRSCVNEFCVFVKVFFVFFVNMFLACCVTASLLEF